MSETKNTDAAWGESVPAYSPQQYNDPVDNYIAEAEGLARLLRVASGGHLTLAVVNNNATTAKDRQGMNWGDAHEAWAGIKRKRDAS